MYLFGKMLVLYLFFQMKLNMHFYDSFSSINRFEEFIYWRRSLVLQKLFVEVDKTATKV